MTGEIPHDATGLGSDGLPTAEVYEGVVEDTETKRLISMAERLDAISASAIFGAARMAGYGDNYSVVNVACGPGTGLGDILAEQKVPYYPSDKNVEYVQWQRDAGYTSALRADAARLPYTAQENAIAYVRLGLAWMGDQAPSVLHEMSRVGTVVASESDWSVAGGPEGSEFGRLMIAMQDGLRMLNFDPHFGAKLPGIVASELKMPVVAERASVHVGSISDSQNIIAEHCTALTAMLERRAMLASSEQTRITLLHMAAQVKELFGTVRQEIVLQPDMVVRLPDIVTVIAGVDMVEPAPKDLAKVRSLTGRKALKASVEVQNVDLRTPKAFADVSGMEQVFVVQSTELRNQARRVQAQAFRSHHFHPDIINPDGFLDASVDSPDIVSRSTYNAFYNEKGEMAAVIRSIEPDGDDLLTLPIVAKMRQMGSTAMEERISAVQQEYPKARFIEASGLGKTEANDPLARDKVIFGMVANILEQGYTHMVMGIVKPVSQLLVWQFGPEVFQRVGDVRDQVTMEGEYFLKPVTLVPFVIDARNFFPGIQRYRTEVKGEPGDDPLVQLCAAFNRNSYPQMGNNDGYAQSKLVS